MAVTYLIMKAVEIVPLRQHVRQHLLSRKPIQPQCRHIRSLCKHTRSPYRPIRNLFRHTHSQLSHSRKLLIVQLAQRLQVTVHVFKAQRALAAHQAIAHQQQVLAAQQALLAQSNAQLGQSTVATEHVRKHQVQALAAALQAMDLEAHQHIRLQQRATAQDQATLAALFSVQPGPLMQVTEHVRKIQAQATDLALAIQVVTSQSIAATRRQVVTHQQPRHRLARTFLSGSNSLSIKTLKPAPQDAGFFYVHKKSPPTHDGLFKFFVLNSIQT